MREIEVSMADGRTYLVKGVAKVEVHDGALWLLDRNKQFAGLVSAGQWISTTVVSDDDQ